MSRSRSALAAAVALGVGESLAALAAGGRELELLLLQLPIVCALGALVALAPLPARWLPPVPLLAVGLFHMLQLVIGGLPRSGTDVLLVAGHVLVWTAAWAFCLGRSERSPRPGLPPWASAGAAYALQALGAAWLLYPTVNARWAWTPWVGLAVLTLLPAGVAMLCSTLRAQASLLLTGLSALALGAAAWPLERAAHTQLPAPGPLAGEGLPDVVLVVLDTTRADRLSLYGHDRPTSPRLEELAQRATVYERAISPAVWTLPGHAALFTGLWPPEHGADWYDGVAPALSNQALTLAERFRMAGYRTACVASNLLFSARFGLTQGFELVWSEPPRTAPLLGTWVAREVAFRTGGGRHDVRKRLGALERGQQAPAGDVLGVATSWLDDVGGGTPRFLFVNLMEAHGTLRRCPCGSPVFGEGRAFTEHDVRGRSEAMGGREDADAASLERLRDWYDGQLACVDHHVGELMDALRARGMFEDALVVVTADHGEMLGDQRSFNHKGEVWDGLVHVPLVLKVPGQERGARCDAVTSIDALAAALPALAGLPPALELPSWAGERAWLTEPVERALLGRGDERGETSTCPLGGARLDFAASMAVRKPTLVEEFGERWDRGWLALHGQGRKWVQDTRGARFAVEAGPWGERLRELEQAERAQLEELVSRWHQVQLVPEREQGPRAPPDEENLRALRELGYVGDD